MSNRTTHAAQPVELPLNLAGDPPPAEGCDVCQALGEERREARAERDMSKVSDTNVEIRRHPHTKRRRNA
jgi:hypothetical protein